MNTGHIPDPLVSGNLFESFFKNATDSFYSFLKGRTKSGHGARKKIDTTFSITYVKTLEITLISDASLDLEPLASPQRLFLFL